MERIHLTFTVLADVGCWL